MQVAFMHTGRMMIPVRASEDDMWEVHVRVANKNKSTEQNPYVSLLTQQEIDFIYVFCINSIGSPRLFYDLVRILKGFHGQYRFTNTQTYNQHIALAEELYCWFVRSSTVARN